MAAPRLPFLWPVLMRAAEPCAPPVRAARAAVRNRAYHPSCRRKQQETITQRYGTANEPPPHLGGGKSFGPRTGDQSADVQVKLPKIGEKLQRDGEKEVKAEQVEASKAEQVESSKAEQDKRTEPTTHPEEHPGRTFEEHSPPVKAPHLEPSRYVHHFDSYGLVKRLNDGGWSEDQSVTAMKAMRLILADNMDLAKEALVSKSMVENETYLFRAACAELKTEVMGRRKGEQEKMRTERTQLQHEVDILGQRLGQETATLKDELKGMFDDRKMAVRNEQRSMESKIQQLNYKITVELQADARSEVEGLRWVMTRRVILSLFIVVVMILFSLRQYSLMMHEREMDAKR
ncbi:hypothetical protein BAUCODRAFT_89601, partial [Baudoinia panamericana UAMH 10762]